jgi:hypothetical protein
MASPPADPAEIARLSQQYREYARFEMATHGSPIYATICAHLADDPAIGGLGLRARPGFRTPLILLAAVHHLLLSGLSHGLAAYYPSLAGEGARPIDDGLYPTFANFVRDHRGEVEQLIGTRTTQTNEARRTVLLVPPLSLIAANSGSPLALLEVGCSAGLNLLPDRYGFRFDGISVGDSASPVQIDCAVEGDLWPPLPTSMPNISWRAGLDLNPLDIRDPDTIAWLRALIWPEHIDRMAILDAAASVALRDPPRLFRGDLVDDLATVAAQAPSGEALVVTDTWVLAYVTRDRRLVFVQSLRELAAALERSVWLVSCEGQDITASLGLGLVDAPPDAGGGFSQLSLHRFGADGRSEHRLLAACHAHGRWIRWRESASAGAA